MILHIFHLTLSNYVIAAKAAIQALPLDPGSRFAWPG